jgi:hypothetical protein
VYYILYYLLIHVCAVSVWQPPEALRFILKLGIRPGADLQLDNCGSGYFKRPLIRAENGL